MIDIPRFTLLVTVAILGMSAPIAAADRPNIVLIMADDLGAECLGCYGGTSYQTPVLDRMAETGLRFSHCYSQPLCTPSRVQLMTGMYNVRNYTVFGRLEKSQTTFAQLLRGAGYATCIVGKWQLGKDATLPAHFGFEEHCLWQLLRRPSRYANPGLEINGREVDYPPGKYGPDVVTDYACDFIGRHREQPFLLYYPMILTHCPFEPTPDSDDWDPASKGSKTYKGNPEHFGDTVTYMDKIVGRLLERLEEVGVRDNTLVLFTTDNGTDSPVVSEIEGGRKVAGGKGKMTDAGTHVPLIASWPGHTPTGVTCDDLVDFSDFFPTLCEVAEVEIPDHPEFDGRSFLAQLQGQPGEPRDWIYCWYSRNGGPTGREFARTKQYKLYRSGTFYNVATDQLEQRPLDPATLAAKAIQTRETLQSVLDRYATARPAEPPALPGDGGRETR